MKNTTEIVNDLLERRDAYQKIQRHKRRTIGKIVSSVTCICLIALVGMGIWQGGWIGRSPVTPRTHAQIANSETGDTESSSPVQAANHIVINHIDHLSSARAKMNINLAWDDFVEMDTVALKKYYGIDIFPQVPSDLTNWDTAEDCGGYGIFRRNKGDGEVYWDQNVLNYSNADFTRKVNIELAKGRLPFVCFAIDTEKYHESVIADQAVYIGLTDGGAYQAQFVYKDVGFILTTQGLTQREVIQVIESITQQS